MFNNHQLPPVAGFSSDAKQAVLLVLMPSPMTAAESCLGSFVLPLVSQLTPALEEQLNA